MQAVIVIWACIGVNDCDEMKPFIGEQMPMTQCMATSQAVMADFQRQYGYRVKGVACVDPKRLANILQRGEA